MSSTDNGLSKRQTSEYFGVSFETLNKWISRGEIQIKEGLCNQNQFIEGHHYVRCEICAMKMASVSSTHCRKHGISFQEYKQNYPGIPTECALTVLCRKRDQKTISQQKAAVAKFWNSEEGQKRREFLSNVTKNSNESNPTLREKRLKNLEKRNTTIPKLIAHAPNESSAAWHRENREESLLFASHARAFRKSTSKLHLRFKAALEGMGVVSETEYKFGFYSLDEAIPDKKISIEIDGCYWHGCDKCKMPGVYPPSQESRKITYLENRGWRILRVKECDINRDIYAVAEMVSKEVENG